MDEFKERLQHLHTEGQSFLTKIGRDSQGSHFWYKKEFIPDLSRWILSVTNLVTLLVHSDSHYLKECIKISENEDLKNGVPFSTIQKLTGLLESLTEEISLGLLRKIEYMAFATIFDDFLDHAEKYHKGAKLKEAGILASIVFEDTIRKICEKNNIDHAGISIEDLIGNLKEKSIITAIKAKRYKGLSGTRNEALHAQWDNIDLKDVGALIKGTKEIIESHL